MNKGSWKGLVNNPLGIIGFFLVIVEGIAAVVITQSTLSDKLNGILVWFITLFPVAVLLTFIFLVVWHSDKLYSPKDFQDEKLFMQYTSKITSQKRKVKLKQNYVEFQTENLSSIGRTDTNYSVENSTYLSKENVFVEINIELETHVELKESLKSMGFRVKLYDEFREYGAFLEEIQSPSDAIWLSSNVDYSAAITAIKQARTFERELKFIKFNNSFKDQIFIGSTVEYEKGNKRSIPLKEKDFTELYQIDSQQEFRQFINRFQHKI